MTYFILLCLALLSHSACLTVDMNGEGCQTVQEAGEQLAENVDQFDKLLQEIVMRCYEESKSMTEASLKEFKKKLASAKLSKNTYAPITSVSKMKVIYDKTSQALDATFDGGHAKFFSLVKRGGQMVVGDSIVIDALIRYPQKRKRRDVTSLNGIDGKILTLRNEMNTSLIGVEQNLRKVNKHLFDMLTDSLKSLVDDQQFKTGLEKIRGKIGIYLIEAIHNVIESYVERFFLLVKHSAQVLEKIDSIVASLKSNPAELAKAIAPAKVLVDEAISDLKKKTGVKEMKRQLTINLLWMRKAYQEVKTSSTSV